MDISFKPLTQEDFPQLVLWLNKPHVQKYWDRLNWTIAKVKAKYEPRINNKDIRCYIMQLEKQNIGLIQIYDAYKFLRSRPLVGLPKKLGAIDLFIAQEGVLGKGVGAVALDLFIENYADFEYILVDPQKDNIAAIKTYQKCGFKEVVEQKDAEEIWMIRKK